MQQKDCYLTVHGHFYQPPRENPWLETIELQDSALPFHNWNERIAHECYSPNAVSRIVDVHNSILDIVNNYELISFNFGPTLLSWLEVYAPRTYERIIEADRLSMEAHNGHGNAIAQVYNHMIMPLANSHDKYTQTIWGIKDFQYRFGRRPEGIWLAETAVDDETLRVLVDCGIKYTILSPFQASKVKPLENEHSEWQDVSWGNVDPGRAYRYFLKDGSERFIDLFFYDGSISKSVAFENLLQNGDKFIYRVKDGISDIRDYPQLINIGTDGESYGHHTRFGEMALAYALKRKANDFGFKLSNYAEYLELHPPVMEIDIKDKSSWSCFHGVGRWKEDCGCSTGAGAGWNQRWRKPLREALDWLREQLDEIFEAHAKKYLKDPWKSRNKYIDIMLDRNILTVENFCSHEAFKKLTHHEIVEVVKLLEMQRHAMLMYTSCGWFFADISGIETVQILKYAARSMQIAEEFAEVDLESTFLEKLADAQSNLKDFGSGKDIYINHVKPSIVSIKQVVSHWSISSLFENYAENTSLYCYDIKTMDYKKARKGNTAIVIGRIEITSKITFEQQDMIFAMLHYGGEDFHCVIRGFAGNLDYLKIKEDLVNKFYSLPLTEVIRALDEHFGREYFTLKDLFIEERRKIINILIKEQLDKFTSTYRELYEESKGPMMQLSQLGLKVPSEFKIAAEYTLSKSFNELISEAEDLINNDVMQKALDIAEEAKNIGIVLDTQSSIKQFNEYITDRVKELSSTMEVYQCEEIIKLVATAEKLSLKLSLTESQNIYFNSILSKIPGLIKAMRKSGHLLDDKKSIATLLNLGDRLKFNVEKYYTEINKVITPEELLQGQNKK
ncbi:MAG: DUF3536 domain-containing protein [bacterium]